MSTPAEKIDRADHFSWFEYPDRDFPYYNGLPARISGAQWWFLMLMVALGFLALIAIPTYLAGNLGQITSALLFFAISLLGLALVASGHWTELFWKVSGRDVTWMIAFALLNILASSIIAILLSKVSGLNANSADALLAKM